MRITQKNMDNTATALGMTKDSSAGDGGSEPTLCYQHLF